MRFAIWTAVSSKKQAEGFDKSEGERGEGDKESLPSQENKCRSRAISKGWTETTKPFVVPGESRTRWVNLRDAENEIPALRQMLESAKAGKFDILIMYDYNRLRDLLDPVAKTLASYGVQIYSINQPVEPLPPEQFNPYASDSENMMRGLSKIISDWQIADLRRKYQYGIPARVRKGLYAIKIPYGYRKPPGRDLDRKAIPIPDKEQSQAVIAIKDLFLAGDSYDKIIAHLYKMKYRTATGAPWAYTTIKSMLRNPFYAGKVYFGRQRSIRDPRHGTRRMVNNPTPLIMDGKHQALYSWDEYLKIQIEFEHRRRKPTTKVYPFSGLLKCSVCGGKVKHNKDYWWCKNRHVKIKHIKALEIIPKKIKDALADIPLESPQFETKPADTSTRLGELERKRKQIQNFVEREIYTPDEGEQRIKEINAQMESIRNEDHFQHKTTIAREVFYAHITKLRNVPIAEWIIEDSPEIVNPILLRIVERIEITPEHKVTVFLRG